MEDRLVHVFSVKTPGARHWKLVGLGCDPAEEYPSPKQRREMEEEVMIHFPGSDVRFLATAEAGPVTMIK